MTDFKRGIRNRDFVSALRELAASKSWWRDVLEDSDLLIAVRDDYLNVYWMGQSIFKIRFQGSIHAETHPKYLLDPGLQKLIPFDGERFDISALPENALIARYEKGALGKLKRAAELYAGDEKRGVHSIARLNSSVVDLEIAVSDETEKGRADIATFEKDDDKYKLCFWEAKLFSNSDLKARDGKPKVLEQIARHQRILGASQEGVLDSYRRIASDLVTISEMARGNRTVGQMVKDVAMNPNKLTISSPPDFGLLIYGFDIPQREFFKDRHLGPLTKVLGDRVLLRGEPKGLKI